MLKVRCLKWKTFIHQTVKPKDMFQIKGNQRDMITKYNVESSVKTWIGKKKVLLGVSYKRHNWDDWRNLNMLRILDDLKLRLNAPNIQSWHIVGCVGEFPCSQEMTVEGSVTVSATNSQMVQKNYVYIHYTHICTHIYTKIQGDKNKESKCGKVLTTDECR